MSIDPITLEVLRNGLTAIAEEMNANLIRTSYSPNIKERRDCSCAVFGPAGEMISQAENIPVHLGAMPFSVSAALEEYSVENMERGDSILLNDPFRGGAHLPDLTLITPIFLEETVAGFAANRAHHADVGGASAGSISATATDIYQEGIRIPPIRVFRDHEEQTDILDLILANTRDPTERRGDLRAQQVANQTGVSRFKALVDQHGRTTLNDGIDALNAYAERRMRAAIDAIPDGTYTFEDVIEDDGCGNSALPIRATIDVEATELTVDFAGSAPQTEGALNAVRAVTVSATYYAIRCLTDPDIPANAGSYRPISVTTPEGTIVNASHPAAVVGGNLETSQRIVDVLFGAFATVLPEQAIAASQGTMNNLTFGGVDPRDDTEFAFYETIAGGMGARASKDGLDAVQIHMTNTENTPIEVIETAYPLAVRRYELRPDSGGPGRYRGGLGIRRDIEVLADDISCSVVGERRKRRPFGIAGGKSGAPGADFCDRGDGFEPIPAKTTMVLQTGDLISIRTPGGGGYGDPKERKQALIDRDRSLGKMTEEWRERADASDSETMSPE